MNDKELKKYANWAMVVLAITTTTGIADSIIAHKTQGFILAGLVLIHVFYFKS